MATYYIDFATGADSNNGTAKATPWKHAPGMTGRTGGYSHVAGDQFIFKGGVTWDSTCFPWTVPNSGSTGNPDTYGVDVTWFTGGVWAQPIFDANHTSPSGGMLNATTKSFLTFDNLNFTNYGTTLTYDGTNALDFLDCHDLAFTNLTLTTYSQRSMYVHFNTTGTYSNFLLDTIDCSHTCSLIWFACGGGTVVANSLTIVNCHIHDFSDKIGGAPDPAPNTHSDGFIHIFGAGFTVNGAECHNNIATGDFRRGFGTAGAMSGFFFCEQSTVNWKIYNNILDPFPVQANMSDAFILLSNPAGTVEVYNNTINNPGTSSASAGIHTTNTGTYILRNNLVTGFNYAVYNENLGAAYTSNNNLYNSGSGQLVYGASFQSYATWKAAGRDVNSVTGVAPTFTSSPSDVSLAANSAGLGVGADLSSLGIAALNFGYNGVARSAGAWDIGAYQRSSNPFRLKFRLTQV